MIDDDPAGKILWLKHHDVAPPLGLFWEEAAPGSYRNSTTGDQISVFSIIVHLSSHV